MQLLKMMAKTDERYSADILLTFSHLNAVHYQMHKQKTIFACFDLDAHILQQIYN